MSFDIRTEDDLTNYFLRTRAHAVKPKESKPADHGNYFNHVPPLTFASNNKGINKCNYIVDPQPNVTLNNVYKDKDIGVELQMQSPRSDTTPELCESPNSIQSMSSANQYGNHHQLTSHLNDHGSNGWLTTNPVCYDTSTIARLDPQFANKSLHGFVSTNYDDSDWDSAAMDVDQSFDNGDEEVQMDMQMQMETDDYTSSSSSSSYDSQARHHYGERTVDLSGALQVPPLATKPCDVSWNRPEERIEMIMQSLSGGDALFKASFEQVNYKMMIAYENRGSSYLFRDFAGHFSTLLDNYGPGGHESQHAPPTINWILQLIMPWLDLDADEWLEEKYAEIPSTPCSGVSTLAETKLRVYDEVSNWLRGIVRVLGKPAADIMVTEGIFELYLEHMAIPDEDICEIAYPFVKMVVKTLPPHEGVLCKLLLLRNMVANFEQPEMFTLRNNRIKLLNAFAEQVEETKCIARQEEYIKHMENIVNELERSSMHESDCRILKSLEMARLYCHDVMESVQCLGDELMDDSDVQTIASNSPSMRLSLNINKWTKQGKSMPTTPQPCALEPEVQGFRARVKDKLRRLFKVPQYSMTDLNTSTCTTPQSASTNTNRSRKSSFSVFSHFSRPTTIG